MHSPSFYPPSLPPSFYPSIPLPPSLSLSLSLVSHLVPWQPACPPGQRGQLPSLSSLSAVAPTCPGALCKKMEIRYTKIDQKCTCSYSRSQKKVSVLFRSVCIRSQLKTEVIRSVPFDSVPFRSVLARVYVPGRMNVRGCIAVHCTVTCTQISSTEFLCSGNQNCSVSCEIALTSCALRTHCRV